MSKVLIFPTDTVYGIGTPIFDMEGMERIYAIKHRDRAKPLVCLCADIAQIEEIAFIGEKARRLIERFLPGPLTLILKSKEGIVRTVGYQTIGVRIPKHELALRLLRENGPMLTTSVNDSGSAPLNEYNEIVKRYDWLVDEIYSSDTPSSCIASTVIACTDENICLLREGEIKFEDLNV